MPWSPSLCKIHPGTLTRYNYSYCLKLSIGDGATTAVELAPPGDTRIYQHDDNRRAFGFSVVMTAVRFPDHDQVKRTTALNERYPGTALKLQNTSAFEVIEINIIIHCHCTLLLAIAAIVPIQRPCLSV